MSNLTAFSWGYWGWGAHTAELVRVVDGIERAHGKRPPVFVDIRFSGSMRAVGFREGAFENGSVRAGWPSRGTEAAAGDCLLGCGAPNGGSMR